MSVLSKKLTGNASSLKKYIEDEDLLEDTLVETQQPLKWQASMKTS